jgi:hypothetical protein
MIYGNKAALMWGEVDPSVLHPVWAEALGGFEPADVREALDAMVRSYTDFPPTLPQFTNLCIDAKRRRLRELPKLDGPRIPMPDHVREQLAAFKAKATRR